MSNSRPAHSSGLLRTVKKFFVSAFVIATFILYVLHERSVNPDSTSLLAESASKAVVRVQPPAAPTPTAGPPADNAAVQSSPPVQVALASALPSPTATAQPSATPTEQPSATATEQAATDAAPVAVAVATTAPTATPEPTFTPLPTPTPYPTPTPTIRTSSLYIDGQYTGIEADAFYGPVQVNVLIQDGKLVDVQFLEYPTHRRTSVRINQRVAPILQTEALQSQSARVNLISGATLTSRAFSQSLQSALDAARSQS
ncbi:MAG: FMN-binding protein [Caldilineaceae bacterium]